MILCTCRFVKKKNTLFLNKNMAEEGLYFAAVWPDIVTIGLYIDGDKHILPLFNWGHTK